MREAARGRERERGFLFNQTLSPLQERERERESGKNQIWPPGIFFLFIPTLPVLKRATLQQFKSTWPRNPLDSVTNVGPCDPVTRASSSLMWFRSINIKVCASFNIKFFLSFFNGWNPTAELARPSQVAASFLWRERKSRRSQYTRSANQHTHTYTRTTQNGRTLNIRMTPLVGPQRRTESKWDATRMTFEQS